MPAERRTESVTSLRSDVAQGDKGGVMKRNNFIAVAVGTIMGTALASAYADDQFAPTPDNQQASQPAPNTGANAGAQANPAPFGANADRSNLQQSGPQQSGERDRDADHHDMSRDRRDIGRDQSDIRADRQDIRRDRADLRADERDLHHDYAEQRAGANEQSDIAHDRADIRRDRQDLQQDRADVRAAGPGDPGGCRLGHARGSTRPA